MVNKLVVSLVVILMVLGIAIYFRVEFKYMMVLNGRGTLLLGQLSKISKTPLAAGENPEDRIAEVAEKSGIHFATDYLILESALFKSCKDECLKRPAFYQDYIRLINQITIKNLWVVEQNRMKDNVAYYIQDREQNQFLNNFVTKRAYVSDSYNSISSYDLKEMALALIQAIDAKVMEIKKKK